MEQVEETMSPIPPSRDGRNVLSHMAAADQLRQLREAFELFDTDNSNTIDAYELQDLLDTLGVSEDTANVDALFAVADADGNGEISFEEFCAVVGSKVVPMTEGLDPEQEMEDAWSVFIAGSTGEREGDRNTPVNATQLYTVLERLELGMSLVEAEEMVRTVEVHCGRAATGSITLDEWKGFMRSRFGLMEPTPRMERV
mmetsp:Transcript_1495/g.4350  ORF Transcript_1495/g.4350 Transcript_1495/m.4350 type:complete len:199 (-) Transcript_1495:165-761(-)